MTTRAERLGLTPDNPRPNIRNKFPRTRAFLRGANQAATIGGWGLVIYGVVITAKTIFQWVTK